MLACPNSFPQPTLPSQYLLPVSRNSDGHPSEGAIADIQSIWSYQATTLDWGDLGYNFPIDREGTVYRRSRGRRRSSGAHALGLNHGAIGIALLGNYEDQQPRAPMLASLRALVTTLANRYGINVPAR